MKTSIYVFSGTGTSLWVAEGIQKALDDCRIISMTGHMASDFVEDKDSLSGGRRIGFVFPCYFGEMPQLVKDFVGSMDFQANDYVFSVMTAGRSSGYGLKVLNEILVSKGTKLSYGTTIAISSNYMAGWYYEMIKEKAEVQKKRLEEGTKKVKEIAGDIEKGLVKVDRASLINYMIPNIISPKDVVKDTRFFDTTFSVSDACTGCGTCERVCPVSNISLQDGRPDFNHNCQRCMACVQYCPKQAFLIEGKAMNKTRYYHPDYHAGRMAEFKSKGREYCINI